ncbi:MAG: hypothetical protein ACREE9_17260 [Stellaceae bacterium]
MRSDDAIEPHVPSPAEIAGRVRVPAALQHARKVWNELRRRAAALQAELKHEIALADTLPEHKREPVNRRIVELDRQIAELGPQVRAALSAVSEATPAFAEAIESALATLRRRTSDDAMSAIDALSAALRVLAEIDREILPLDPHRAWCIRPLQPSLGPLRRRILALRGGGDL